MSIVRRPLPGARRRPLLALGALALLGGCDGAASPDEPHAAPLTVATDSASNPTVAYDAERRTGYVAWIGVAAGQNAVFVSSIGAGGEMRGPVRANDLPGDAAPHLQAPAQVAVGPEGNVYVLWQNNTPLPERRFPASDLRLAVSTDGGRTFRPAITVNDDAGGPPSSHTFHDIAVANDGTVHVSWIDSRERDAIAHQRMPTGAGERTASGGGHHADAEVPASHDHGSPTGAPGPEIRVARSIDGGRSFEPSMVVDSAACPCCRTSLAIGADGTVYVAWRKIYPGDIRDIVVARAEPRAGRFSEPVRVHRDEWVFPGCPHAGPSLALDEEGRLLVGWYTGKEGRQGLWYTVSEDGGQSFHAPSAVLTGAWVPPSQLRLAARAGRLWAAWDDRTNDQAIVRTAIGAIGAPLRPLEGAAFPGGDPSIATAGDGALVAWLDGTAARARWTGEE